MTGSGLKIGLKVSSPYSLEDVATDLVHLLDGLNIEKAHLVGISLGGMFAQVAAINSGDRVKSLACIATQARNSRYAMPKLPLNTLVIHGAEDPLISPEAGKEIADAVPGAKSLLI